MRKLMLLTIALILLGGCYTEEDFKEDVSTEVEMDIENNLHNNGLTGALCEVTELEETETRKAETWQFSDINLIDEDLEDFDTYRGTVECTQDQHAPNGLSVRLIVLRDGKDFAWETK